MNENENAPQARVATVSQLNSYIKRLFDHTTVLSNIWIRGEISNFKRHYSGHLYITLKDEGGVLKAVMFRGSASGLDFEPADGMKVLAHGKVSCYEAGGVYQLYIDEMIQDGIGRLHALYEKLKKQLAAEGLFDAQFKKPIPQFPQTVGVITAPTGAAVRDIINVITRRYPLAEIVLYPTQVQGTGAAESVARAIEYFNEHNAADVLIVGRGGGSIEDLWAFNEEITARAVFASEIPIISAVGHETDFTICDFVADLRAPTPSAAAEIAVPSQDELKRLVGNLSSRIENSMRARLEHENFRLKKAVLRSPAEKLGELGIRLDNAVKQLEHAYKVNLMKCENEFSKAASKLNALSPLSVLSRGYSIAVSDGGAVLKNTADVKTAAEFTLRVSDGSVRCKALARDN